MIMITSGVEEDVVFLHMSVYTKPTRSGITNLKIRLKQLSHLPRLPILQL